MKRVIIWFASNFCGLIAVAIAIPGLPFVLTSKFFAGIADAIDAVNGEEVRK